MTSHLARVRAEQCEPHRLWPTGCRASSGPRRVARMSQIGHSWPRRPRTSMWNSGVSIGVYDLGVHQLFVLSQDAAFQPSFPRWRQRDRRRGRFSLATWRAIRWVINDRRATEGIVCETARYRDAVA